MKCSYCGERLPEGDTTVNDIPNVFLHNKQQDEILALHAECLKPLIEGLRYAETLVTN